MSDIKIEKINDVRVSVTLSDGSIETIRFKNLINDANNQPTISISKVNELIYSGDVKVKEKHKGNKISIDFVTMPYNYMDFEENIDEL